MTIATTTAKVAYAGNGTTTAFAVPFPFFASTELQVIERNNATGQETPRTLTTHYTVAGGNGSTGTVTAVTAPPSTVTWTIRRNTARTQLIDYLTGDAFPADTHERGLDRLVTLIQDIDEELSRCLQASRADPSAIPRLPSAVDRASRYLAFDAAGLPVAALTPPAGAVVSPFMSTLLDDADAAAARATLGLTAARRPVNYVSRSSSLRVASSAVTPYDGTLPLVTEGAEIFSQQIVMQALPALIVVDVSLQIAIATAARVMCASLHVDGSGAVSHFHQYVAPGQPAVMSFRAIYNETVLSPRTFSLRLGMDSAGATWELNGTGGGTGLLTPSRIEFTEWQS